MAMEFLAELGSRLMLDPVNESLSTSPRQHGKNGLAHVAQGLDELAALMLLSMFFRLS